MKDEITVADDLLFHTVEKLKQLDHANLTDEQERTRRELAIYKGYFDVLAGIVKNPHSDGKNETAREYVGQHIHPGYLIMPSVIALYTNDAIIVPPSERFDCVYPLSELMVLIGARWRDADNAAMNVRACLDDIWGKMAEIDESPKIDEAIKRWLAEPDHYEPMTADAKSFLADFDRMKRALRQRLIELSAVLMGAPASGVDSETLAAVQDVAHDVRAARADIAAVGADAHAGRVAAEHAAHDAAAARGDIADSEERTQFVIHKGFEDMEPVKTGVAILVTKKHTRSRNGKAAQRKAKNDPEIQSAKKRAADDMHRALERVCDDSDVIAGNHGAVLTACRRLCDWKDDAGHIHHGKFEQLTTSKKYGEPQYAPLMDWQGNPIKPETLARNFRDARKAKPKLKRGKK